MQQKTAAEYALPYFRSSIEQGFQRYGSELTRSIVLSQGEEAVFVLQDYLANMLASSVVPRRISSKEGTRFRDEYVFDLVQMAKESDFPPVRIFIYDHAGKLALFTATVIPESLLRTSLNSNGYVGFANAAYGSVVAEQRRFTGDASPVYILLAEKTGEIADVLLAIAEENIRMHSRLMVGRPLITLEQIASQRPLDVVEEAQLILDNLR